MSPERVVTPAAGELKQQLTVECAALLATRSFNHPAFKNFLSHMFTLMGSIEGIETPELTDATAEKHYTISLEKRDPAIVVHILPTTTDYEGVSMGEMIFWRDHRAYIQRRFFNNRDGQEISFSSYLGEKVGSPNGELESESGATKLNGYQLKNVAQRIFTAWQKSQDEVK